MIHSILAQVAAHQDWITPVSGLGVVGFLGGLTKWLMTTITNQLTALKDTINSHTRSLERALDHNTRATLLMGLAQDEASTHLKDKLKNCLSELDRKQERDKRGE